jgi:hypothetical protein
MIDVALRQLGVTRIHFDHGFGPHATAGGERVTAVAHDL